MEKKQQNGATPNLIGAVAFKIFAKNSFSTKFGPEIFGSGDVTARCFAISCKMFFFHFSMRFLQKNQDRKNVSYRCENKYFLLEINLKIACHDQYHFLSRYAF